MKFLNLSTYKTSLESNADSEICSAMAALEDNSECMIMLASLGVCSVGLNLVAANQVILADSWWAPGEWNTDCYSPYLLHPMVWSGAILLPLHRH